MSSLLVSEFLVNVTNLLHNLSSLPKKSRRFIYKGFNDLKLSLTSKPAGTFSTQWYTFLEASSPEKVMTVFLFKLQIRSFPLPADLFDAPWRTFFQRYHLVLHSSPAHQNTFLIQVNNKNLFKVTRFCDISSRSSEHHPNIIIVNFDQIRLFLPTLYFDLEFDFVYNGYVNALVIWE